jgi:hypothetical protein
MLQGLYDIPGLPWELLINATWKDEIPNDIPLMTASCRYSREVSE